MIEKTSITLFLVLISIRVFVTDFFVLNELGVVEILDGLLLHVALLQSDS